MPEFGAIFDNEVPLLLQTSKFPFNTINKPIVASAPKSNPIHLAISTQYWLVTVRWRDRAIYLYRANSIMQVKLVIILTLKWATVKGLPQQSKLQWKQLKNEARTLLGVRPWISFCATRLSLCWQKEHLPLIPKGSCYETRGGYQMNGDWLTQVQREKTLNWGKYSTTLLVNGMVGIWTYTASEHEFLIGLTGITMLWTAFPVTERAASAYRLDTSESTSDIEPVFFFRVNAFPNELSWNHNNTTSSLSIIFTFFILIPHKLTSYMNIHLHFSFSLIF